MAAAGLGAGRGAVGARGVGLGLARLLLGCSLLLGQVAAQAYSDGTVESWVKIGNNGQGGLSSSLGDKNYFGSSIAEIGDLDGDNITDVAVGARSVKQLYILFLKADGTVKAEHVLGASDVPGAATTFGASVASLGDLDGDGVVDLAVGAIGMRKNGFEDIDAGGVYILFLNTDGSLKAAQLIADNTTVGVTAPLTHTLDASDSFGKSVAALGDLDGDGVIDLAVGAVGDDDGGATLQSKLESMPGGGLQQPAQQYGSTRSGLGIAASTPDAIAEGASRKSRQTVGHVGHFFIPTADTL